MRSGNKYKRNFILLLWGTVIFIFICYTLAFKKTIGEYKALKKHTSQLSILENAPLKISIIDNKLSQIGDLIGSSSQDLLNSQGLFLAYANKLSPGSGVIISELPEVSSVTRNGLSVYSQQIVFQGPFSGLLQLLRSLEKEKGIGNIASVSFYTQKERRTAKEYLKMKIIIQSIQTGK